MTNHLDPADRDDLDRPAPAVLAMSDDQWRDLVDGLDAEGRRKLFAGELSFSGFADDGAVKIPVVVPDRLRAELELRG